MPMLFVDAYVICRLDISYAVTFMARFSQHPTEYHYKALKNIARYLRATKSWGLMYWRSSPCQQLPHVPFETVPPDPSLPHVKSRKILMIMMRLTFVCW